MHAVLRDRAIEASRISDVFMISLSVLSTYKFEIHKTQATCLNELLLNDNQNDCTMK